MNKEKDTVLKLYMSYGELCTGILIDEKEIIKESLREMFGILQEFAEGMGISLRESTYYLDAGGNPLPLRESIEKIGKERMVIRNSSKDITMKNTMLSLNGELGKMTSCLFTQSCRRLIGIMGDIMILLDRLSYLSGVDLYKTVYN